RGVLPAGVHIYDPRTGTTAGTGRAPIACNGVQDTICLADVDPAALAMAQLNSGAQPAGQLIELLRFANRVLSSRRLRYQGQLCSERPFNCVWTLLDVAQFYLRPAGAWGRRR